MLLGIKIKFKMIKLEFIEPNAVNMSGILLATFNELDLQINYPWQPPFTFTVYKEITGEDMIL